MFSRISSRASYQLSWPGSVALWQGRSLSLAKPSRRFWTGMQRAIAQAAQLGSAEANKPKADAWRAVAKSLLSDWQAIRSMLTGNLNLR